MVEPFDLVIDASGFAERGHVTGCHVVAYESPLPGWQVASLFVDVITSAQAPSLALKSDGTIITWTSPVLTQVTVPSGASAVVAISAGSDHGVALVTLS
jgi:hypothetical protein